jgi:ribose transport system ATP-binding protein
MYDQTRSTVTAAEPEQPGSEDAPQGPSAALLDIRGLVKAFPGVRALGGVSLTLRRGEILALVGENGAGKSTLVKCIAGLYSPDSGSILLAGEETRLRSTRDAFAHGIAVVPQERNLVPQFSAGENIMLEALPTRRFIVDYEQVYRQAQMWLDLLQVPISAHEPVTSLSVAQMQLVEIARAISRESRILLLDEPTASISPEEASVLFDVIRRLRDRGVGIIFVSHKLEEVFALCDQIVVLRDGLNAGPQAPIAEIDREKVVTLMIGRAETVHNLAPRTEGHGGPVLEVRHLDSAAGPRDVSLTLHRGEILGLYGLVGAGRSEVARAIIGADRLLGGQVLVEGRSAHISAPGRALNRYSIGYVPEDRKLDGLIEIHSVLANMSITIWRRLQNAIGWVPARAEREQVKEMADKLDIKAPSLSTSVGSLSGGNQQKVSLGKWLIAGVKILIVDEPTVGIDVRTKANIHDLLWDLASQGIAILLISSDLPEMVRLADRVIVMREGRVSGELENNHEYDKMSQRIMAYIH